MQGEERGNLTKYERPIFIAYLNPHKVELNRPTQNEIQKSEISTVNEEETDSCRALLRILKVLGHFYPGLFNQGLKYQGLRLCG